MSVDNNPYCVCGVPWGDSKSYCSRCEKQINPVRQLLLDSAKKPKPDYCDCGIPVVNFADNCGKCKKRIDLDRLKILGFDLEKIANERLALQAQELEDLSNSPEVTGTTSISQDLPFCSNCGDKVASDGNFCQTCGKRLNSEFAMPSATDSNKQQNFIYNYLEDIPFEIRNDLKQYSNHKPSYCLSCGYKGLMGVTQEITNDVSTWPLYAFSGFIGLFGTAVFGPIGIIGALIVAGVIGAVLGNRDLANRKTQLKCPRCFNLIDSK
jgi:Double zinc ribbon